MYYVSAFQDHGSLPQPSSFGIGSEPGIIKLYAAWKNESRDFYRFYPSSIWTPSPRNTWIADCIRKLVLNYDIQFADLTSSSIQESLKRISRLEFLTISHHNGCQRLDWSNYPVRLALLHLLHLPTLTHFEMSRIGSYSLRQPQELRYRLLYDCGSWKSFPCNFAWAFNPTERIRSRVQNLCRHHDHWFWISV